LLFTRRLSKKKHSHLIPRRENQMFFYFYLSCAAQVNSVHCPCSVVETIHELSKKLTQALFRFPARVSLDLSLQFFRANTPINAATSRSWLGLVRVQGAHRDQRSTRLSRPPGTIRLYLTLIKSVNSEWNRRRKTTHYFNRLPPTPGDGSNQKRR